MLLKKLIIIDNKQFGDFLMKIAPFREKQEMIFMFQKKKGNDRSLHFLKNEFDFSNNKNNNNEK